MQEYTFKIKNFNGLRKSLYTSSGAETLAVASNLLGEAGKLVTPSKLTAIDVSALNCAWPFPQFFLWRNWILVLTINAIYRYDDGVFDLLLADLPEGGRWSGITNGEYAYFTNESCKVVYDPEEHIFKLSENAYIVTGISAELFNGQFILAGVSLDHLAQTEARIRHASAHYHNFTGDGTIVIEPTPVQDDEEGLTIGDVQNMATSIYNGFESTDFDLWIQQTGCDVTASADSYTGAVAGLFTSVVTDLLSTGITGTVYLPIPASAFSIFRGNRVRIQFMAKQPTVAPATEVAVSLGWITAQDDGSSGWHNFNPTTSYALYGFTVDVPANVTGMFIGIHGDTSGSGLGTLIDSVSGFLIPERIDVDNVDLWVGTGVFGDAHIANLSANKLLADSAILNRLFLGNEGNIELDGTQDCISIYDKQTPRQLRVRLGRLNAGDTAIGIEIYDPAGNVILGSGGIDLDALGLGALAGLDSINNATYIENAIIGTLHIAGNSVGIVAGASNAADYTLSNNFNWITYNCQVSITVNAIDLVHGPLTFMVLCGAHCYANGQMAQYAHYVDLRVLRNGVYAVNDTRIFATQSMATSGALGQTVYAQIGQPKMTSTGQAVTITTPGTHTFQLQLRHSMSQVQGSPNRLFTYHQYIMVQGVKR
jgi:hypothetical protein